MKTLMLMSAVAMLAACKPAEAPADNVAVDSNLAADVNAADANASATATPMALANTSWEWTSDGKPMVISIDPAGAYIIEDGDGKHVDHGTYALTNGRDCFTSAMGAKTTNCYSTTPEVAIGDSAPATDDKGVTQTYKRVEYRALKMPS